MVRVNVKSGENIELVVRRFKRTVLVSGVVKDMRRVAHYQKPSEKKRARNNRQRAAAHKRAITTFSAR